MIYASRLAFAVMRGGRHQLSSAFPRSPGIIPVALSVSISASLHCDCSIKERGRRCGSGAKFEAFVLNKFFTAGSGE